MNEPGIEGNICAETVRPEMGARGGYVYFITDGEAIKIGYSTEPKSRLATLQVGSPRQLRILASVPGTEEIEQALHRKFVHLRVPDRREWFRDQRYEIINMIEGLMAAANPSGPIPLLPHTDDIAFEQSECGAFLQYETLRLGTLEYRQNTLRHRLYTDLLEANGGIRRVRDSVRNTLSQIADGTHPMVKGKFKPWPPVKTRVLAKD